VQGQRRLVCIIRGSVAEPTIQYELDSLAGFLKLSTGYYQATKDASILNADCALTYSCDSTGVLTKGILGDHAIDQIFKVMWEQSQATFDEDFNFISYYNWTGGNGALSPAVPNGGNGEPKGYSGLVGTHHRPSDDISTFGRPPMVA
jgi:meiotically up-regulated gene 157 (Mug157) protein